MADKSGVIEAAEGVKANNENFSVVTQPSSFGGKATTVADDDLGIARAYDEAQLNNDKEGAERARLAAKGKQAEQDEAEKINQDFDTIWGKSTEESRKAALEKLDNIDATKHYEGDKLESAAKSERDKSLKDYSKTRTDAFAEIDKMNEADAAANASDLSNEIAQHDITTEEGKKAVNDYLEAYESMLHDKEQNWNKSYKRALIFSALSSGIAAATGTQAIDFTQHPDVTIAREQLDKAKQVLDNEKATSGKLSEQRLNQKIADRQKRTADKEKAELDKVATAKELLKSDQSNYDQSRLVNNMNKYNLSKTKADLGLDIEAYEPRAEEAKASKRFGEYKGHTIGEGAFMTGTSLLPDVIKAGANAAMKL